jgi:predicted esterase
LQLVEPAVFGEQRGPSHPDRRLREPTVADARERAYNCDSDVGFFRGLHLLDRVSLNHVSDLVAESPRQLVELVCALDEPAIDVDVSAGQGESVHLLGVHDVEVPIQVRAAGGLCNRVAEILDVPTDGRIANDRQLRVDFLGVLSAERDFLILRHGAGRKKRNESERYQGTNHSAPGIRVNSGGQDMFHPIRTFEQRHLRVARSARYSVMGSFDARLAEVWIVCHGHGQLASRFLTRFIPIERGDRLFVAPEALSRYYLTPPQGGPHAPNTPVGATWMTSEDRENEIQDYIDYLDILYDEIFSLVNRKAVRLWVLGFSQGCATVARWVARGKADPDRVVLWAGLLPPELSALDAAALSRRAPLTVVLGRDDDFAKPDLVAAQESRLKDLGVAYQAIRFDGGHEIVSDTLRSLAENQGD